MLVSLPLCAFVLYKARESNYDVEGVVRVEEVAPETLGKAALPKGCVVDGESEESCSDGMNGKLGQAVVKDV